MVVKIINTIVKISNSQMLKYAGHSEQRGVNICFFQRSSFQFNPFQEKREFPKSFLSNEKLLTSKSRKEGAAEIDKGL